VSAAATWLWHGFLPRCSIALLTALWKAGKTTLLSHLVKALGEGGSFCGHPLEPGRTLYVSEENATLGCQRRDRLGLGDYVSFQVRPFLTKPSRDRWLADLVHLEAWLGREQPDLVVLDTLSALWTVRDENNAAEVAEALMPLERLARQATILLVHHPRKGDGGEATASRGSGALPAFVDTILEPRRHRPGDRACRRRVLTAYGRFEETTPELVVELAEDGSGYQALGSPQELLKRSTQAVIRELLPTEGPGLTTEHIRQQWPDPPPPARKTLLDVLRLGTEQSAWLRGGRGSRNDPFTYHLARMNDEASG
jgi:hypothetical protein